MIRKLRLKFICVNMLIVTLMLTAIFGMVYHLTRQGLETQSEAMLQSVASDAFHPNRPGSPPQEVHLPFFVLELDGNGGLTASGGGYYDLTDQEFLKTLADAATDADAPAGVLREYSLRYCRSVTPRGERIAFADMSSERATLKNLTETCAAIGVLCFAAFLLISWLLARWAVKPVETAWQQQRQFVADASHELKTPLTVIMTNAELLQMPEDTDSARRCADSILTMSRQMRLLVERLLELARTDSAQNKLPLEEVDLSALTEDGVLPFEAVFFEAGLTLATSIQPGITVTGSRQYLGQLLDILLDNARKYALGGEIQVELYRVHRHRCRLVVSNTAEPKNREELQAMFKRFYRGDPARSRDGSFGLGLSIAENIVSSHAGKLWAESREGRLYVLAELPCKEEK